MAILVFAGVLIWSAMHIFDKSAVESQGRVDFAALLEEDAALNVYTYACNWRVNYAYDDFGAQVPDGAARQAGVKRCLEHRNEQLLKWNNLVESADSKDILARGFFYKGGLHYADAYDNHGLDSANLAVQSLEVSLSYEPGFIEEGFSEFDYNRRELIEMARNLRDKLDKEEEQKKKKEQASRLEEQEQSSGKKGEVGGIEVPIMEQGVKP
ncbi:MAG: hypothetical protein WAP23_02295 [Candidatus Spechtbacterales bacterium]